MQLLPYVLKDVISSCSIILVSLDNGWYPEVVFLTVVLFNSSVTAVLFPNAIVFLKLVIPNFFKFFSSKSGQITLSSIK